MGLIAFIIDSFSGSIGELSAKVERYKGDNANARVFNPPGVDARPLDGDICFTEDSEDTEGGKDVLGFIDPKNVSITEKGGYRAYSRDSSGNIVASIHIKTDGSVDIEAATKINIIAPDDVTIKSGDLIVEKDILCDGEVFGKASSTPYALTTHESFPGNLGFNVGPPLPVAGGGVPAPASPPSLSGNDIVDGNGTKSTNHIHSQGNDSNGDSEVDTGVAHG